MSLSRSGIISALGVIQILAWGSTFYLMAPLAEAIGADTGWSPAFLSAGVSVALLVSGLAAPAVGRWIGRTGGRVPLSLGLACLAAGLVMLGLARGPAVYLLAWGLLGLGMAASLYDAAFSVLGVAFGQNARAAITQLTLWGGFASTVCWPLSAWLVESFGWRVACFSYAALHLCVTLPLCRRFVPRVAGAAARADISLQGGAAVRAMDLRFLCIVIAGVLLTMLSTIWSIHMVTILTAGGSSLAAAIALGTLIGPAQVGARVVEMLGRGRHHPIWTMGMATGLVLIGFAGLQAGFPAAVALIAYGAGNGLWSIARGALPLALFGPDGYAALMGRLARPMLFSAAAAPTVGAFLIERIGAERTMTSLAVVAVIPLGAALLLAARVLRERRQPIG